MQRSENISISFESGPTQCEDIQSKMGYGRRVVDDS